MRPIDADALIEEVNKKQVVGRFNTIMLINDAPTVEQKDWKFYYDHGYRQAKRKYEKPQGEWIECGESLYTCSVCGIVSCCKGNYCSECGADLRSTENE